MPRLLNQNIPCQWKNNNCESMNHKIKVLGDWKKSKLPDLVERLKEIDDDQCLNVRGAIHGRGNFELASHARSLFISHENWLQMDSDQRKRQALKLASFKQVQSVVTSTDAMLSIPLTSSIARKPGQTKRVRNAKTTSFKKVKR